MFTVFARNLALTQTVEFFCVANSVLKPRVTKFNEVTLLHHPLFVDKSSVLPAKNHHYGTVSKSTHLC